MKYLKLHIFTGMLALLVSTTACSTREDFDPKENEGLNTHTFSFQLDGEQLTRADGFDGSETGIIGTGSKTDYLIFAIYDSNDNLLTRFAKDERSSLVLNGKTVKAAPGQNILKWEGKTINIQLASLEEGSYKIACWAQSSECDAYDTSDLKNVKVSYENAFNNDESRDAFSTAQTFTVSATNKNVTTVILHRPLAQINVGTSGADFKMSARIPGGTYYTYSEISFKGLGKSYNVLQGKASTETTDAIFKLNKLPAYWNMEVPTTATDKVQKDGEQFLLVDLDNDKNFKAYRTFYPTIDDDNKYLTETFKYMSMCYVLVAGSSINSDATLTTGGSLNEVSLLFSGDEKGQPVNSVNTSFTLTNVPALMNFRTNILGGLTTKKPTKPTDPDNPDDEEIIDDPSTLFSSITANVTINVEYLGDKKPIIMGEQSEE